MFRLFGMNIEEMDHQTVKVSITSPNGDLKTKLFSSAIESPDDMLVSVLWSFDSSLNHFHDIYGSCRSGSGQVHY